MLNTLFGNKMCRTISQKDARERLEQNRSIILLDVRTPEEYRQIHIPGSVLLPLDRLGSDISKVAPDKDAEIIVYCQSGMRAAKATCHLASMGYTNVSNMGGIQSWGYEVESGT